MSRGRCNERTLIGGKVRDIIGGTETESVAETDLRHQYDGVLEYSSGTVVHVHRSRQ